VVQAAFSGDGRRLVTVIEQSTARLWDVSLEDRPAADWLRLVEFMHGHRLDRHGALEPLSQDEMKQRWQELRAKYPQDFTVTPDQVLAWHRREAEACLKEKNPSAALFHTLHSCWQWHLLTGLPRS
jgi:hypothetical protein